VDYIKKWNDKIRRERIIGIERKEGEII